MALRDADELMAPAVGATIAALDLKPEHAAAVKLAERYAAVIDAAGDAKLEAWVMRWIAPLLLDCLESLGATPAARSRIKEARPPSGPNGLTALREARRA